MVGKLTLLRKGVSLCASISSPECDQMNEQFTSLLPKVANSKKLINYLLVESAKDFIQSKERARSAPQISQLADEQQMVMSQLMILTESKNYRLT